MAIVRVTCLLLAGTCLTTAATAQPAPSIAATPPATISSAKADDGAAQKSDTGLQDIVVTASRRSQNLQDVPISVERLLRIPNFSIEAGATIRFRGGSGGYVASLPLA